MNNKCNHSVVGMSIFITIFIIAQIDIVQEGKFIPSISNILTFDVEEWFQVYNLWEAIPRSEWVNCERRLENQIEKVLDLLDEFGKKATFFVLGWVAKHRPEVVKSIHRRGHEIASHGLNHDLVTTMDAARFRAETLETGQRLEDLTGRQLHGYRASNFSIRHQNSWAFDILAELGYSYDSSVYPIGRKRYGIPGFPREPVKLKLASGGALLEFPLTTLKAAGKTLPVAGGGFFRFYPLCITRHAINSLNRKGIPAVIYLHPWEFDQEQPRIRKGNAQKIWMHYHNLDKTENRLRRLLSEFKLGSVRSVLEKGELNFREYSL